MGQPTNQANSAFHPSRVAKWVVIHACTWNTEVETVQTADYGAMCGFIVEGQSPWTRAWVVEARLHTDQVYDDSATEGGICKNAALHKLTIHLTFNVLCPMDILDYAQFQLHALLYSIWTIYVDSI